MTDERIERVRASLRYAWSHGDADYTANLDSLERELTELREALGRIAEPDPGPIGATDDRGTERYVEWAEGLKAIARAALSHHDEVT